MYKNTKKVLIAVLACFIVGTTTIAFSSCQTNEGNTSESTSAFVEYENGFGFSKNKTGDGYYVVDIEDKTLTEIEIPQTYNGLPVVRIEDGCFDGFDNLTEVFIPISIKEIGDDIFGDYSDESNVKREIYYAGSLDEWKNIAIEDTEDEWIGNVNLYSEDSQIDYAGKYWNYNSNGEKQKLSMSYTFWQADFYSDRNSVGSYTHTLGVSAESFSSIFMKPDQGTYIHDVFKGMNDSTLIKEMVAYFELTNFLADGQPSEEARRKGRVDLYVCALLDLFGIQEDNSLEKYDFFKDDQALAAGYETVKELCGSVGKDSLALMTKADVINANITDNIFKDLNLFGNAIEQCTTVIDAVQLYNRALKIQEYGQNVHDILIAISEESTAPEELKDAAKLLVGYIDKGFAELLKSTSVSILNTSFSLLTNCAMKFAFHFLCEAVPVFKGINLVAKGFQAVNDVIGLDAQCAAYYKLRTASILEVVSMNLYNHAQHTYLEGYTTASATQYMNAVDFFKRSQYVGNIYYVEFLKTLKENAITDFRQGEDIDELIEFWLDITKRHFENFNNFEKLCLNTYNTVICNNELSFSKDIEQNPEETIPEGAIPENALKYNGNYYYVYEVNNIETWEEAQKYCEAQGGYLATITTQEENNAIYTYLKGQGIKNAYFGATDKGIEGKWEWITGEPFVYSNWGSSEPNDEGGNEDYIMFYENYLNGEWNDGYAVDFSTAHIFICEWGELDFTNASQELEYELSYDETHYSVVGIGNCTDTDIVIPSMHKNLPVKSIGRWAFEDCIGLKSIKIPNSVTSIGEFAFYECTSLENIEINASIESIGLEAFSYCENLKSIVVDKNNLNYTDINGDLYSKDGKILIQYAAGKKDKVFTIPNGVIGIEDYAFSWCTDLTSVIIPNSVKSIGEAAFNCCGLDTVEIPSSIQSIGSWAFNGCNLKVVEIPNSVLSIGERAFSLNQGLKVIEVAQENPNYKSIDGNLYSKDGKKLIQYALGKEEDSFIIPDTIITIEEYAFNCCCNLESITISNSIEYIGYGAFDYCPNLKNITFKGTIEEWAAIEKSESGWDNISTSKIICVNGNVNL